jgi:phosphoribosyl 1,2-cyclic phosphodiesterase
MRIQILGSGSEGNSALVRAGETTLLVDAGLTREGMELRLDAARVAAGAIDHVCVTHGHLDHARSAGVIARRDRAMLHCAENIMLHAAARRSKRLSAITVDRPFELDGKNGGDRVRLTPVGLPHDCDPTVAFKIEHGGRTAVILTDIGKPDDGVARALSGAHVLVLEFNYDPEMMRVGPYPIVLQRRITGSRGHLSNAQAAIMLEKLAGPELHTLVLAHLSKKTNRPELALDAAHATLDRLGLSHVRVLVASQDEIGEDLAV